MKQVTYNVWPTSVPRFTVWTKGDCKHCVRAKRFLDEARLDYDMIEITPENRHVLLDQGFRTVPQIWHGDHYVGGAEELEMYLINNGWSADCYRERSPEERATD